MEHTESLEKILEFARNGKGRRLLNALNKRDNYLTPLQLSEVLNVYCESGLKKEVETLKKMRGILSDEQYHALAEEVRKYCTKETFSSFAEALRNLISCGIKMNPAKNRIEE